MWSLGQEKDCCTKLVANTETAMELLGAVNVAFKSSPYILNLRNLIHEKFINITHQRYLITLDWHDDKDFVRSPDKDKAMCNAIAGVASSSDIHIVKPLHILLLGDISPHKFKELHSRAAGACPTVMESLQLHTKLSLMPSLRVRNFGGDDIKGQVSFVFVRLSSMY